MKLNLVVVLALPLQVAALCPPTGPILPKPRLPEDFEAPDLRQAIENVLDSTYPTWNVSTTSFSVELTSSSVTLFEYHHTAETRSDKGVEKVDTDTVYRVASITKVFNVLALLLNAPLLLDTAIGGYLPELERGEFGEMTLRDLASNMAGLRREVAAFDWYSERGEQLQELGFPVPPLEEVPACDTLDDGACSRSDLFEYLLADQFTWLPGDRAAYSNPGFTLLGYALENITSRTFVEILQEDILTPLGLGSTSMEPPDASRAIIPVGAGEAFMGYDIGTYKASAGLYSTPRDVTAFLRSILGASLLSPTRTRQWLRPVAYAGGLTADVGMPWEIYRVSHLTPDRRPVDVYTKSGGIPGYASMALLLPEYDVGATILVSSDKEYDPSVVLVDVVLETLIPQLESLAREQAEAKYAGSYVGGSQGANGTNSTGATLTISVDDGPGLRITEWTNRGKSILDVLASDRNTAQGNVEARLYPVGEGGRWRVVVEGPAPEGSSPDLPSGMCKAWFRVDRMRYASLSFEEFVFEVGEDGVTGVRNPGLRQSLTKSS